ncbi:MAG: APC family permease [Planctomycetales bacterium]|nr:APC family permease [Planctomycetales bacterium]
MKRSLTLTAIVSIIFFNVSGGPYGLESVLKDGPGLAMLLILITPLLYSAPVAFIAAELGTAIPEEGGYYVWSKRALGKFPAFCQGWWAWMFTFVDVGICPALFCDYLSFFFKVFDKETGSFWARKGIMLTMIWVFVLLNLRGARTVGNFAKGMALMILSPFIILIGWGLYRGFTQGFPHSAVTPFLNPDTSLVSALALAIPVILWNYQGWDAVSTCAGEMDNPRRDYPRALMASIVLITGAYALPALIGLLYFGSQGIDWTTGAWSIVAEKLVGRNLGYALSAMGMVAGIGLYSGLVLVYSRVPFVMARDGFLPQAMMYENKYGAPTISLLVCGVIYSIIVMIFNDFEEVAKADVTLYTGKVSMEMISFLVLRWREPELHRPFRVPGGWPVAILIACLPLACIATNLTFQIMDGDFWKVLGIPLCMMATGPLLYPIIVWYRSKHPQQIVTHDEPLPPGE